MNALPLATGYGNGSDDSGPQQPLFERLARALASRGYAVEAEALPYGMAAELHDEVCHLSSAGELVCAGTGRNSHHMINTFVRRDRINWIDGRSAAQQSWLAWCAGLQQYLNRRLFLGLFSFESHFSHYPDGAFYRKHLDTFRPDGLERGARRVLSLVAYLNPDWMPGDGGELLIYGRDGEVLTSAHPRFGSLAVFLSAEVPHEVLPARRDRFSIAGWYRVNGSLGERPDPPR